MNRRALLASTLAVIAAIDLRRAKAAALVALSGDEFVDPEGEVRLADILALHISEQLSVSSGYAEEARKALQDALVAPLRIQPIGARDRWGRRVAMVFSADDDRSLQEKLVAAGAAQVRPETGDYDFIRRLLSVEEEARAARRGLWRLPVYLPHSAEASDIGIGAFRLVEGAVLTAEKYGGRYYLNFGEDYHTDFTVTAKSDAVRRWRDDGVIDLASLAGAPIRVRGYVAAINGPSIEVVHPLQVELISRPS